MACLTIEEYMEGSGYNLRDLADKVLRGTALPALCQHGCEVQRPDDRCVHGCPSIAVALVECGETWEDMKRRAAGG